MGAPETGSGMTSASRSNTSRMSSLVMTSCGRAARDEATAAQREHVVGVAGRQVHVVQHHDDRRAAVSIEVGQQIEHLDLVGDVEERRRLVEQQDVGLLRERHRDPDALPLAAGELVDGAVGEVGDPGRLERLRDHVVVVLAPAREQLLMRMPAAADEVGDHDPLRVRSGSAAAGRACGRPPSWGGRAAPCRRGCTWPERGVMRRARARSSVDLPHPFAPTIAVMRPVGICRSMPSTIVRSP